eukprot:5597782-Amphidinium_carterae.1
MGYIKSIGVATLVLCSHLLAARGKTVSSVRPLALHQSSSYRGPARGARFISAQKAYIVKGLPVDLQTVCDGNQMGSLFEKLAKVEHGRRGWTIQDAEAGLDVSGHKRGQGQGADDFRATRRGAAKTLKVEVKSAKPCWDSTRKCWCLSFQAVKLQEFDALVLGVLTPSGAELWEH